jgi:hypothetical protein
LEDRSRLDPLALAAFRRRDGEDIGPDPGGELRLCRLLLLLVLLRSMLAAEWGGEALRSRRGSRFAFFLEAAVVVAAPVDVAIDDNAALSARLVGGGTA